MLKHVSLCTVFALLPISTGSVIANDATSFSDFFAKGDAGLNLRYRLEAVDQDGFAKNATASTLQTKLWFRSADLGGFSGFIEVENVVSVGKETYNNTVNGNITRSVVADPENTALNQAYLSYKNAKFSMLGGRKGVNMNNLRFVGTVGWRQNDQTLDLGMVSFSPTKGFKATYGYVWQVNRIFGNDHPLGEFDTNTHILDVSYDGLGGIGKLTAHGLLIDINNAPAYGLSSKTFGVRLAGKKPVSDTMKLGYELEYANQSDYGDNPSDYSANYIHVAANISTGGFTIGGGYEELGSDNGVSFKTPLATLHKFNGWADKFLATPASGLKDAYASIAYKVGKDAGALSGLSIKVIYHNFTSDIGGIDYGSEIDWVIGKKLTKHVSFTLKGAHYNADTHASDTTKIWAMVVAKF